MHSTRALTTLLKPDGTFYNNTLKYLEEKYSAQSDMKKISPHVIVDLTAEGESSEDKLEYKKMLSSKKLPPKKRYTLIQKKRAHAKIDQNPSLKKKQRFNESPNIEDKRDKDESEDSGPFFSERSLEEIIKVAREKFKKRKNKKQIFASGRTKRCDRCGISSDQPVKWHKYYIDHKIYLRNICQYHYLMRRDLYLKRKNLVNKKRSKGENIELILINKKLQQFSEYKNNKVLDQERLLTLQAEITDDYKFK